jgi:predicted Zn-dependent peptidase
MVDEKKTALQVAAFNYGLEDYGAYITLALPNQNASLDSLLHDIDEEVVRLQTELISDIEYKKLLNQYENNYVNSISRVLGVAENLAEGYMFYHNTNHINEDLKEIQSISKEEIRAAAQKYLNSNQRVVLYYMPPK